MNDTRHGAFRRFSCAWVEKAVFSAGILAALAFGLNDPAAAEDGSALQYGAGYTAVHVVEDAKPDPMQSGPLFAVISIADQRITVYGSGGQLASSKVSTGMRGHATPTGVFSIVQKQRWHASNIYSGAPMPLMQRITWSGIALHEGVVPGYPASHGCIRLPGSFAARLFRATEIGQRVIVAPTATTPVEVAHKTLPVPLMLSAPGPALPSAQTPPATTGSVATSQSGAGAVLEPAGLHEAPSTPERLNPLEFARALKKAAVHKANAAMRATKEAMQLSNKKATELRLAARKLDAAESATRSAATELAAIVRRLEKTDGKEAIAETAEEKSEAEAALAEAKKTMQERIAKATQEKAQSEPALTAALKAKESRIAQASEAKAKAEAELAEAQKSADPARIAKATEAKSQAETALTEAQTAEDARIVEALKMKTRAEAELIEAQKSGEQRIAEATEAKAEAERELAAAQKAEEERVAKAAEAKVKAEAELADAQKVLAEARAAKQAEEQELTAAHNALAEAKANGKAAAQMQAEATRRLKPLSVFISRKTGRLYVRQNFEPLFDVPVTIRDPEREIGTHVYVSVGAAQDGSALRWLAVSMPSVTEAPPSHRGKGRHAEEAEAAVEAPAPAAETAQGALDRISIPEDVSQRLAELTWIGASVIVSDYGISGETDRSTDFIILTKPKYSAR